MVTFDRTNYNMVFWRGTNYNMNLVTENGIWVGDQSAETSGPAGCAEHMSDKQCRYAHVRIIENSDARAVVHWRYACSDVLYNISAVDPETGWGAWADEYYYIYPDGIAIRNFFVHGISGFSLTEPAIINNPGQKAEDNIRLDAVTLANIRGEIRTYSWDPWPGNERGLFGDGPKGAIICILNLKSAYKPCYVYEPRSRITPYGGGTAELRPGYSHFPTWNHWPVSQAPSDGRYALVPDRVSSSAITSPRTPAPRIAPNSLTRKGRFIMGLSDKPIEHLVTVARSWLNPPELKIVGQQFVGEEYSRDQQAYIICKKGTDTHPVLDCELRAADASPLVDPVFIVKNWGTHMCRLSIDGSPATPAKDFRAGLRHRLEGSDLVLWVNIESASPVKLTVAPLNRHEQRLSPETASPP